MRSAYEQVTLMTQKFRPYIALKLSAVKESTEAPPTCYLNVGKGQTNKHIQYDLKADQLLIIKRNEADF